MKSFTSKTLALSIMGLAFSSLQITVASAGQNGANLPPPPSYAQQVRPNYGQNPYTNNGPRNYGSYPNMNRFPGNFPNMGNGNFPGNMNNGNWHPNNMRSPNFGPQNFNAPRMNSNDYPMPWNRNGNNSPMMSSQNMPMMNSSEWARKVPDWGEKNGPYKAGPWASDSSQDRMEGWWDDMINAPHDMGRMPGGWKAPSFSMPNPVDVSNQLGRQFDKLPGQVQEMDVSN